MLSDLTILLFLAMDTHRVTREFLKSFPNTGVFFSFNLSKTSTWQITENRQVWLKANHHVPTPRSKSRTVLIPAVSGHPNNTLSSEASTTWYLVLV